VPVFILGSLATEANGKTKVQNIFCCLPVFGLPELLPISEQKVDTAFRLPA
jgi:hypothetical protein